MAGMPDKPKNPGRPVGQKDYTAEQVETALIAAAMHNGNTRKAADVLAADPELGFKINQKTIWRWIQKDPQRYREVQQREMPRIRVQAADTFMQLSAIQAEVAEMATKRLKEEIPNLDPKDLSKTVHHATLSSAISTDKAREYRGEATTVVEHRNASEVLRELQSAGFKGEIIEGDAVEELPWLKQEVTTPRESEEKSE